MIKKVLSVAFAAMVVALLAIQPATAVQRYVCDPQQSMLCVGLGSVFQMEEASDYNRDSVAGGVELLEAPNTTVARAAGKIGSYAASFSGVDGTYLYIPRGGQLGNTFTVAMWVYPTSSSTEQIILSSDEATAHGPYLSLVPSSGALKFKAVAYYGDAGGDVSVTSTSTMTLNAWHLVVWGVTPYFTGQQSMFVQVDNGARYSVALTYWLTGNGNDLIVGQRKGASAGTGYTLPYSGRIDQLTFSSTYWETDTASLFYNAGSGAAYPFTPSSYASLNAGLIGYWSFDEVYGTGGTRNDSVNQNNAADPTTQVPSSTTAKFGNSASRTVNGSRLSVTSNSQLEYNGDFSVGGWAYITSWSGATGNPLVAKADGATFLAEWYIIAVGASQIEMNVNPYGGGAAVCHAVLTAPTTGAWHFFVADYTASTKTCTLQIDNGTVGSGTTITNPSVQSSVPISFGGDANGSNGHSAYFDEWFLYKRLLTTQQKTDLYNSGNGRTYPF